jgi:hypothetical protein
LTDTAGQAAASYGFEKEYERLSPSPADGIIEITKLRVIGLGLLPPLARPRARSDWRGEAYERRQYLDRADGWGMADIYRGRELLPGHSRRGPLIVGRKLRPCPLAPAISYRWTPPATSPSASPAPTGDPEIDQRVAVVQNRLNHICQQMERALRTVRSPIFSHATTFPAHRRRGSVVSQADGIPIPPVAAASR